MKNSLTLTRVSLGFLGLSALLISVNVGAQPTDGWTQYYPAVWLQPVVRGKPYPLKGKNIPKSYDDPEHIVHYDKSGGVETFMLNRADSNRIEMRVANDYEHGMRQFEGSVLVSAPTDNESLMQVFGGSTHATAAMFRGGFNVNGGEIRHGSHQTLISGIYGKWVKLNVIHDADGGTVTAFINNQQVGQWKDNGFAKHYFKYGAYGTHDDAHPANVKWKNIKYYYKGSL